MIFQAGDLPGVWLIDPEPRNDERGTFFRAFCRRELAAHGIDFDVVQSNMSVSRLRNTLRGLHYQTGDAREKRLFRCIRGRAFDVVVDMRPESPTFMRHMTTLLSEENGRMLYIPDNCAHGFLTLEDDTRVLYLTSNYYSPENEAVIRWNDPAFGIAWPTDSPILSGRDATADDYPFPENAGSRTV